MRGAEQGASEATAGDLAGTARVGGVRRTGRRTRREIRTEGGQRPGGTNKETQEVTCQQMRAQAEHHQPVSVVPATDGDNCEPQPDLIDMEWTLQPD